VTPETVGITQEMIRNWASAEALLLDYADSCGSRMDSYQEMKSAGYELDAKALAIPITNALKDARDAVARAQRAFVEIEAAKAREAETAAAAAKYP
jgi:hypothetical protein